MSTTHTTGRSRWLKAIVGLMVVALLAAACGGDDDSGDAGGGGGSGNGGSQPASDTLVVAFERDPARIDPFHADNYTARSIGQAIFDPLLMVVEGEIVPVLAESVEFPDDETIVFELREGVTFHNGETFDAAAAVYSVERMFDTTLDSHLMPQFESIVAAEAVDEYTLELQLSGPDAQLVNALALLMMVPPEYTEEVGHDGFEAEPVGTGPYTFVSYVADDRVTVEANPDYWEDSPKGMPLVDRVEFRSIPEMTTRVAELNTGGVHIAHAIDADQVGSIEGAGQVIEAANDFSIRMVQLNASSAGEIAANASGDAAVGFEALEDPRVRQALNLAIDREAIVETYFSGMATPIGQPFAPGSFALPSDPPLFDYDPDRAIELLAEAGYPDGLTLQMLNNNAVTSDEITLVLNDLAAIGITVERETLESGVFNEGWTSGQWPHLRYMTWGTPDSMISLLLESGGLLNTYENDAVNELVQQQRSTMDPDARSEVLAEMLQLLHDEPMGIYLWAPDALIGVDAGVDGWSSHPDFVPVTNVTIS
ncbi:MAG: ABC transporter substrate-binding protein [Acidimicrobiales bacterium]